jgi:hypothetical protein
MDISKSEMVLNGTLPKEKRGPAKMMSKLRDSSFCVLAAL